MSCLGIWAIYQHPSNTNLLKSIQCCKWSTKQEINRWPCLHNFDRCVFCLHVHCSSLGKPQTSSRNHIPLSFSKLMAQTHPFCSLSFQCKLLRWEPRLAQMTPSIRSYCEEIWKIRNVISVLSLCFVIGKAFCKDKSVLT